MPDPSTSCIQLLQVYDQVMALQTASDITQTAQSLVYIKAIYFCRLFLLPKFFECLSSWSWPYPKELVLRYTLLVTMFQIRFKKIIIINCFVLS